MASSKQCIACKKELPLESFYAHPQMKDGTLNKCKECVKTAVILNRAKKLDYYRQYDRDRANLPQRVEGRLKYAQTQAGKESSRSAKAKWVRDNALKRAAHVLLSNSIRDGKVVKPSKCECGKEGKIHGHHDDYTQPLAVRWLCAKCHAEVHKQIRRNKPF